MMLKATTTRRFSSGLFRVPFAVAASFTVLTALTAVVFELPLRDPDGFLGPSYVRLPLLLAAMILADVVPRTLRDRPPLRDVHREVALELRRRWPAQRLVVTSVGLLTFYLAYVSYRNMKSFLPFVRDRVVDPVLQESDRWLIGGEHPGDALQQLLGTGTSAHVLSAVYLSYLIFVPLSVAAALVWSRNLSQGAWYVSALSFNWMLGAVSYYALPSLGPIYVEPKHFTDLPVTAVTGLQESLYRNRVRVLEDPHATESVHGIAAFASLHVSVVFTAALVAHLIRLPMVLRAALWVYVLLTALATVYFGWHYIVDVFAGAALGALATWLAARATHPGGSPIRESSPRETRVRQHSDHEGHNTRWWDEASRLMLSDCGAAMGGQERNYRSFLKAGIEHQYPGNSRTPAAPQDQELRG